MFIESLIVSPLVYPLVRYQTLIQTEHTAGQYASIKQHFSKSLSFRNAYRGFFPFFLHNATSGVGMPGFLFGNFFYLLTYPLQNAQIKIASASEIRLSGQQIFQNFTDLKRGWSGFVGFLGAGLAAQSFFFFLISPNFFVNLLSPAMFLTQLGIDNIRRNFVVQKELSAETSYQKVYSEIIQRQGYQGLARGALLYPQVYFLAIYPLIRGHLVGLVESRKKYWSEHRHEWMETRAWSPDQRGRWGTGKKCSPGDNKTEGHQGAKIEAPKHEEVKKEH
jgi:hypothetical protein